MLIQRHLSNDGIRHDRTTLRIALSALLLFFAAPGVDAETPPPAKQSPGASSAPLLPQPATHVVDRLNLLSIQQRSDLGRKLLRAAEEEDISIYVLTLNEAPAADIPAYFSKVATHWNTKQLVGFIVSFPDGPASREVGLQVIPGKVPGEGPPRDHLIAATKYASEIGDRRRSIPESVEAASLELLAQFRGIMAGNTPAPALTDPVPAPPPAKTQPSRESSRLPFPISLPVLAAAIAALLLVLGSFIAFRMHRRRFVFPMPEFRYRLCAPFSGGNSVRIDYRVKHRQPPH
jgi:hypothetical protein